VVDEVCAPATPSIPRSIVSAVNLFPDIRS
jgi:hypothetical protein